MGTIIDKVTLTDGTYMEVVDIETAGSQISFAYHQLVLVLADGSGFSVGDDITGDGVASNDGVGVVREKIDVDTVVVELLSGTFVAGNAVDDADPYSASVTTITSVTKNFKMLRTTIYTADESIGEYV